MKKLSRRLLFLTVSTASAATLSACATNINVLAAPDLPRFAYRTKNALVGYRFALAQPELLTKLPCYCNCGQLFGHKHLRDCFIGDAGAFVDHAAYCQTCLDEALDAKRLQT